MTAKPGAEEQQAAIAALLNRHGLTFADELGIDLSKNMPSELFRWLCAALLMSARISSAQAMRAAKALTDSGWTTAGLMAASTWEERVKVLNASGYARYDESTSRMLGDTASLLLDEYEGDLRRLREKAGKDPKIERRLLKEFKGIGDVGADIFFREVQVVWGELFPYADRKALAAADRLGLPVSTKSLSTMVSRDDFPRFIAALVRMEFAKDHCTIRRRAEPR